MSVELSDPRRGALLIGAFTHRDWLADPENPEINDLIGALRLTLRVPNRAQKSAATQAQRENVLEALGALTEWLATEGFRLGAGWSAAGEGQFAHGQMAHVPEGGDAVVAIAEVGANIAKQYGVFFKSKLGPDDWTLFYFTTDEHGSTVTAPRIDSRNIPRSGEELSVAGFYAAQRDTFDDTVGFLKKLGTAMRGGKPSKRERITATENASAVSQQRLNEHQRKINELDRRIQDSDTVIQATTTRLTDLDQELDRRLRDAEQGIERAARASDLEGLQSDLAVLRQDLADALSDREDAVRRLQELDESRQLHASQLVDLDRRITALEQGQPEVAHPATIAGFYTEAVMGPVPWAPASRNFAPRNPRVTPRMTPGRLPPIFRKPTRAARPPSFATTVGPRIQPRTRTPIFGRGGGSGSRQVFTGPGNKNTGGNKPFGRIFGKGGKAGTSWTPGERLRRPKINTRDLAADWIRAQRDRRLRPVLRRAPWGRGTDTGPEYGGGGGGGGGAPQDFSNYFDDGQDWDGDGYPDTETGEYLDTEGGNSIEDMLAEALDDGYLDEDEWAALEEAGLDPIILSQLAHLSYLNDVSQQYTGLPPGWRPAGPGYPPHTFIKPDGTPHTFGGGDYNNGNVRGVVGATNTVGALPPEPAEAGVPGAMFADEVDLDPNAVADFEDVLAEEDGDFDEEGAYGPDFEEVLEWGPVAVPNDIPKPTPYAASSSWMEYPGS